jgi:hypothetical protein
MSSIRQTWKRKSVSMSANVFFVRNQKFQQRVWSPTWNRSTLWPMGGNSNWLIWNLIFWRCPPIKFKAYLLLMLLRVGWNCTHMILTGRKTLSCSWKNWFFRNPHPRITIFNSGSESSVKFLELLQIILSPPNQQPSKPTDKRIFQVHPSIHWQFNPRNGTTHKKIWWYFSKNYPSKCS